MCQRTVMEREEVIKSLRACLLCAKGGISLESLSHDYKTLVGDPIPFKRLGFLTLVAFLQAIPGIRAFNRGGQCFIEAVPTQETAHLAKLVQQQKTSTKKSKKRGKTYSTYSPRKPVNFQAPRSSIYQINSTSRPPNVSYLKPPVYLHPRPVISTMQENRDPAVGRNIPTFNGGVRQPSPAVPTTRVTVDRPSNVSQTFHIPQVPQIPKLPLIPPKQQVPQVPHIPQVLQTLKTPQIPQIHQIPQTPKIPQIPQTPKIPQIPQYYQKPETLQVSVNNISSAPNVKRAVVKVPIAANPDPRDELAKRAAAMNLPEPVYNVCSTRIKNTKHMTIFAQVKIGTQGYGSYPKEAANAEEAQKIAAEIALQDITEKFGATANINEQADKNVVMQRVSSIIDDHANGVFMHQIPVLYKQQYKEHLPKDWETILQQCPSITLEQGVDNSFILRSFVPPPPSAMPQTPEHDRSISFFKPVSPGPLKLPEDTQWIVCVSYVKSTTEVYARLVDDADNEKFTALTAEMGEHYGKIQTPPKKPLIQIGNYYALFQDDSWNRVQCIDHNSENGMVSVLFIDFGDENDVDYCRLQSLDKKFCSLPSQAFRLSLSGLEDFCDCDRITSEVEKLLLDKAFYVEVKSRDTIDDRPSATVIVYDTSGPEDVNVNALLLQRLPEYIGDGPKLDGDRKVLEVFVSHVENNGDVYIQIQSENMKNLVTLLNRLIASLLNVDHTKLAGPVNNDIGKMYFAFVDDNWFRAQIINAVSINHFKVRLIDFGKVVTVETKNMIPLEKLSEVATKYPAQALKINLHNIDSSMFDERMVARFNELAPRTDPLLAKVVRCSPNEVPTVELLKRIPPNNLLASINTTLVYTDELTRSQGDDNNNIKKPRTRVERTNSQSSLNGDDIISKVLKPPKISAIGEYFDVHVTMAAHPGNFTVQPYSESTALRDMMKKLQEEYCAYTGTIPTASTVKEGQIYAVEHKGLWYRVRISGIIMDNMVTGYFCDFGDISVLNMNKLRPLKREFYELPYQAIKARLVGIRPINVDWSVEDCLRFQELVVEQNFVSLIDHTEPDSVTGDTVLGLKLINVSTSEDIFIDTLLVNEGRAVFTSS